MGCENESSSENIFFTIGGYTLTVANNSTQSGNFCIYQIFPDQARPNNIYSLVWLSKIARKDETVTFNWNINYSFIWSETGYLSPGMMFNSAPASESKLADPSDPKKNFALFGRENNAYLFKTTEKEGIRDRLTIKADGTIPNNLASIGIAMDDKPTIAINVAANMTYQFTPIPTYWILFGDFTKGEVLDLNVVNKTGRHIFSETMEIIFPLNVYNLSLSFEEDNTWKIID